ncbi:MAG TPA: Lrp/AsnC family transcriptional regulator [Burkholderiaceae bacterium]|nr:Lrp/AsnC family transcriptional regulator [Burkholderiaceae bacterium]
MRTDDPRRRIDAIDAQLIERLHGGFPLTDRPFAQVADELGLGEDEVIERLASLLAHGVLTRFGPLFQIERAGGCFVLAAMAVPEERFDAVAEMVNAWPEVAHNYRREARGSVDAAGRCAPQGCRCGGATVLEPSLNMWFVVAAVSPAAAELVLRRIEADSGLTVWRFPKEREFKVELKLPLAGVADGAV